MFWCFRIGKFVESIPPWPIIESHESSSRVMKQMLRSRDAEQHFFCFGQVDEFIWISPIKTEVLYFLYVVSDLPFSGPGNMTERRSSEVST